MSHQCYKCGHLGRFVRHSGSYFYYQCPSCKHRWAQRISGSSCEGTGCAVSSILLICLGFGGLLVVGPGGAFLGLILGACIGSCIPPL